MSARRAVCRRARVTDLTVTALHDGRCELSVTVVMPDGSPAEMMVQGHCYVPVPVASTVGELDLFTALGLVVEVVPAVAAQTTPAPGSPWADPPRKVA